VGMMKTKAPLNHNYDGDYADRAEYRVVERQETNAVRKAIRQLGDILSKRENILFKITREFKHLTHEDVVSVAQIHQALLQTGHSMEPEDITRAVLHVMLDVDLDRIPYVELFKAVKTSFHEFPATR